MALPANVGTGTVTGTIIDSVGDPAQGTVTFTPDYSQSRDVTSTPKVLITAKTVTTNLASDGSFTQTLVATDDTDLNPSGFTYTVKFDLKNGKIGTFSFALPEGTTVDLADAAPVGSSGGVLITQGPAGVGVPAGGTGGQILAKNSNTDYDTVWVDNEGGTGGGTDLTSYVDQIEPLADYPTSFPTIWDNVDQKPAVVAAGDTEGDARAAIGAGVVETVSGGTGVVVDSTDPANPVVALSGGGNGDWDALANKPAVIAAGATAAEARDAIGAGTSSFSGSYTDLTNQPTWTAADVGALPASGDTVGRFLGFLTAAPESPSEGDWFFLVEA